MKHAYLILAHNQVNHLQKLVSALDDTRNDIYIHWDAKSGDYPAIIAEKAKLVFISQRVDVRWADFSMVEAEYALFEAAYASGPYAYYHLISGVDYPVASQDAIHSECERLNGTEFIGFSVPKEGELEWRTQHRFLFPKDFRKAPLWKRVLRAGFCKLQDITGYRRHDIDIKKGPQWFSCTQEFMAYLLSKKAEVFKLYRRTFTPDESFVQTLCWHSPFQGKVADPDDEFGSCRRYIKWIDGDLKPVGIEDMEAMTSGKWWFARKFSDGNQELIENIKKRNNG